METLNKLLPSSIRELIAEEMELICGAIGLGQTGSIHGGVWDGGSGNSGCIPGFGAE